MRSKLSPWEKIIRAEKRGTGLYLSPDDVWLLKQDSAIVTRAQVVEERRDTNCCPECGGSMFKSGLLQKCVPCTASGLGA